MVVYTFFVEEGREQVKGQDIVNTGSNQMVHTDVSAVQAAAMTKAEPDTPFSEEPQEFRDVIAFTIDEPTAGKEHSGKVTTSHPDIEIASVTWVGQVDENNKYIVGNKYTVIVSFKLKGNVNKEFTKEAIKYKKTTVNGEDVYFNNSQASRRAAYITKTFEVMPPKPVVDIKSVFTQAQADERWALANTVYPTELIVKEGQTLTEITYGYSAEQLSCVRKIVLDYSTEGKPIGGDADLRKFPHLEEMWLGPNVDVKEFLDAYSNSRSSGDGYASCDSQKFTMFFSDSKIKGLTRVTYDRGEGYPQLSDDIYKRFSTRLYSGDVMEVYAKGPSAGYEWCTNHNYTERIYVPDRVCKQYTCADKIRYYFSCFECGKCEYNPDHTTYILTSGYTATKSDHYFTERDLSDKYFAGINSRGERVYWKTCAMCGNGHNIVANSGDIKAELQFSLEGASLEEDFADSFAVRNDRYVSAKMSEWAQNDVQWASQNGILDLNIFGSDYTAPITRLQFASVAVKLAECLIGVSITPAPQGTFVDTDNEYALKAYASGITSGVSATEFNPNGTLTRQQMATFIHRALMYVRDNTNIRYTTYTPVLDKYSDSWAIQSWAKTPMGFMNALGLVKGVSDTAIDPDGKCTIEQAVVVANRSVNADQIGWYQMPLSTEEGLLTVGEGYESRYYFAPVSYAPTQTAYYNSTRIWVDTPASGGQKASENPWYTNMIRTVEPYTGTKAWVPAKNFRPIKDLKDTDAADYNQYYNN